MSRAGSLVLGDCRLDLSRGLLLRGDATVPLRPKAFQLLSHLADNAGRVVAKADLMNAVWPDVFVTEDSLTQAIREVRKALGDDAQTTVRTIARRGYLLAAAAPVPEISDGQPTVAVLRFVNEGGQEDGPFVDGFTEDLIGGLARFRTVRVLARNSTFAFASDPDCDWRGVCGTLGADYVVHGIIGLPAGGIRAKAHLIDAHGSVLWCEAFSALGSAVFEVQEEIAQKIVNRLVTRLDDAHLTRAAAKPPSSLDAYECLLRGLARLRGYGEDDNLAARQLFEQAVVLDPNYALAHSYVALADLAIAGYGEAPAEVIATAVERANHAVTLAPEEPRCHRVLALMRLHAREYAAAEYHLHRALHLNPYDADTMAQTGYLLTMRGRPFEAIQWLDKAVEINPIHPDWYHFDRAMALYSAGDYQGAVDNLSRLPLKTPWRMTRLAACHAQLGDLETARHLMEEIRRTAPDYAPLDFVRHGIVFEHESDIKHLAEGVAKALSV